MHKALLQETAAISTKHTTETTVNNSLESDITQYYQADTAQSLPSPECRFDTAEKAKQYIASQVDVKALENSIRLGGGATMNVSSREFEDGCFTNIYDLAVDVRNVKAQVHASTALKGVGEFLQAVPNSLAATSGGFLYLADVSSGTPRQKALNLALEKNGLLSSVPVVDRETLICDQNGNLSARFVQACGELTIDGKTLSWAGSRTSYTADCQVFGNGNIVITHIANPDPTGRKDSLRVLEEYSRYTPVIDKGNDLVDVGLIALEGGLFQPIKIYPEGKADLFQYDTVIRCKSQHIPRGIESKITIHTVGQLKLSKNYQGAISVGPLLSEQDFTTNAINFDPSLGSNPPFFNTRMVRLAIYATAKGKLHMRLFDGRPESPRFRGVTPREAVAIINEEDEIVWGAFLDPGRTAKISTGRHPTTSYGNAHYLRWPTDASSQYEWVPGAGRPVPSAVTLAF